MLLAVIAAKGSPVHKPEVR